MVFMCGVNKVQRARWFILQRHEFVKKKIPYCNVPLAMATRKKTLKVRKNKGLKSAHVSEFDTQTWGINTGHKRATGRVLCRKKSDAFLP